MYDLEFIRFGEAVPYYTSYADYVHGVISSVEQYRLHQSVLGIGAETAAEQVWESHRPRSIEDWELIRKEAPDSLSGTDFPEVLTFLKKETLALITLHEFKTSFGLESPNER